MASEQRHRHWLWAVNVVILLWLAAAAVALVFAQSNIHSGLKAIDTARRKANASAVVEGQLIPDLRHAESRFAKARALVRSPLVLPLRLLPFTGRQLGSVSALSGGAQAVSGAAITALTEAGPLLANPGATTAARAASTRSLGSVAERADARIAAVRLGPRIGLVAPLARARNRFAGLVGELRATLAKANAGATAVADVLSGPRRYLFFAANNAEMRAGSGMFLSAGELTSDGTRLELNDFGTVTEIPVPPDVVPLSGDLADRWGWLAPNVEWRNLMLSPRFDVAAPMAAQMWVASGHQPVDGVIALDPVALREVMAATGPVEIDGRSTDTTNVEEELLHQQYERFPTDDVKPERREELGRIARAVFAALDSASWSLPRLATGLARAASGRHLMIWSNREVEQHAWSLLGVDGGLTEDSLLVSLLNRGGNKLDYFVSIDGRLSFAAVGDETEVTVSVPVVNRTPPVEPKIVSGPAARSGAEEGEYLGILTLTLPGAARDRAFEGSPQLAVAGRDGPGWVMGFQLGLARGAERTIVAHFRLPGRVGSLKVEPSARVPAIRWSTGQRSWSDDAPKFLLWSA